jgi:hypothetical protein
MHLLVTLLALATLSMRIKICLGDQTLKELTLNMLIHIELENTAEARADSVAVADSFDLYLTNVN